MSLHDCITSVSLVVQVKGGQEIGTASGFFYDRGGRLFFVTNRHVCQDDATGIVPDLLRLKLHTDRHDLTKNRFHDIPL